MLNVPNDLPNEYVMTCDLVDDNAEKGRPEQTIPKCPNNISLSGS